MKIYNQNDVPDHISQEISDVARDIILFMLNEHEHRNSKVLINSLLAVAEMFIADNMGEEFCQHTCDSYVCAFEKSIMLIFNGKNEKK